MSNYDDLARTTLTHFPSESDVHKTQRAIQAALLVNEAATQMGLTPARFMLEDKFKVSERMIRRYEAITTVPEIAQIVAEGRVVVDTAEKIMKSAKQNGLDVLIIAWLSASKKDRMAFLLWGQQQEKKSGV